MSEWRVRVTGKQRKDVDTALVIQAVIALGKQLERERREQVARTGAVEPHGASVPEVAS
jgi:hypothetical protein